MHIYIYIYDNIYIYIIFSIVHSTLTRDPELRDLNVPLGRPVGLQVGLVLPSWAAKKHLGANLGCQGALGRHFGFQLGSNLASRCLPEYLRTFNFARRYGTLATFSKMGLCAAQVLLDCLLAALGAFLGVFWTQLGASWAPLGLNLGSQGRLPGSSVCLLDASWAPLGPLVRLLGQLGAIWARNSLQMGSKWTPTGHQMDAKWAPSWTATTAANFNALLKNVTTAAKSHRTPCPQYFLSPDGDTMQH